MSFKKENSKQIEKRNADQLPDLKEFLITFPCFHSHIHLKIMADFSWGLFKQGFLLLHAAVLVSWPLSMVTKCMVLYKGGSVDSYSSKPPPSNHLDMVFFSSVGVLYPTSVIHITHSSSYSVPMMQQIQHIQGFHAKAH